MLWDPRDELRRRRASPNKPTRYVLAVENRVYLPYFVLPVVLQELVLEEGWEHRVTTEDTSTNWAGCMPESAQAWTNLRYWLGHDGQGDHGGGRISKGGAALPALLLLTPQPWP